MNSVHTLLSIIIITTEHTQVLCMYLEHVYLYIGKYRRAYVHSVEYYM